MMLARWVSLLEWVLFSNAILNLHHNGSLPNLSSNSLINSTTQALSMFPLSSGLDKNTLEVRLFGDRPIITLSFHCGSKHDSPKLSQRINSYCLKTGVIFSPLSRRKTNSLPSAVVLASFAEFLDLVGYWCCLFAVDLSWLEWK